MFGLEIDNFRSFKNQRFDFSRLNVLIGENSSGKSSLSKFLMLLSKGVSLNTISLKYTNEIGRYSDFIYMKESDLSITFAFYLGDEYLTYFLDQTPPEKEEWGRIRSVAEECVGKGEKITIKFSFDKDMQKTNLVTTQISSTRFGEIQVDRDSVQGEDSVIRENYCSLKYSSSDQKTSLTNDKLRFEQHGFLTFVIGSELKDQLEENENIDDECFYDIALLLISQNYIKTLLSKFRYINPIDSRPERTYTEDPNQTGIFPPENIRDVVNILTDESIEEPRREYLKNELRNAVREYGILYDLDFVSGGVGARELRVKVNESSIWTNIKDVGYGSALQIPIIFQAILSELMDGETIIIEQPEVHVHPYLQAKFIETLLSIGSRNKYIIETHSSDIIRKIQVLAKNEKFNLKPNEIWIYYFKKPENVSQVSVHNINEYGKLLPKFPSGFFDSSINLAKELF